MQSWASVQEVNDYLEEPSLSRSVDQGAAAKSASLTAELPAGYGQYGRRFLQLDDSIGTTATSAESLAALSLIFLPGVAFDYHLCGLRAGRPIMAILL